MTPKNLRKHYGLKNELYFICNQFIKNNNITDVDTCYQSDSLHEKYPILMEDILTAFEAAGEINPTTQEER